MILERRYNLFGHRATFRTNHPRAAELLAGLYTGRTDETEPASGNLYELLHDPEEQPGAQWSIAVPGLAAHPKPTLGECLYGIEASLAGDVTKHDHGFFSIHGGVLYTPAGGLLLSGYSGAGKTTLTLALAARGLRVGGDDLALLDPANCLLHPVPRCFHIEGRTAELVAALGLHLPEDALRDQFVTPHDLGATELPPVHARFVFLLEPERLDQPRIVVETQAQAASALLLQTSRARFPDLQAVRTVANLTAGARCFRLWSGDLGATADAVLNVLRQPS